MMNIRNLNHFISWVACFFITLSLTIGQPVFGEGNSFYWDRIDVNLDLQANGDITVTETQTYVFTSDKDRLRYRYIPLDRIDDIRDVMVTEDGKEVASKTEIKDRNFWIQWQHQLTAPSTHTFILKYRVIGGLETIDRQTKLDWRVIFPTRSALVKNAKVRVHVPTILADKADWDSNAGIQTVVSKIDSQTTEFAATKSIDPQQSLIVTASFPANILNLPLARWQQSRSSDPISGYLIQSLPWLFIILIIMNSSWRYLFPSRNRSVSSNYSHGFNNHGEFWGGGGGGDGGGGDGGGGGSGDGGGGG